MTGTRIRRGLAAVAIGAALFATLGEGSSDGGDGGDSGDENSSDESSAPEVGTEKANPAPLGTTIEVAKDWDVTVNSAELDANATMAAANSLNTPADGEQFVLVNVTLANKSDTPGMAMTNVSLDLLPESGVAIDGLSCFGEVPDKLDISADMQPGASATGNLCFSATPEEVQTSVLLGKPTITLDEVEDQRFFAIK